MKISVVSDLHLEFGYQHLPGGEVLILSGDIAEANSISKHYHSTKSVSSLPVEEYACSEFFFNECAKYEKVFYVMGNHEHYHGNINKTLEILESIMPSNVTVLEDRFVEYKGVVFLGATLWTDLNKSDPLTEYHLKHAMNDYRCITMQNTDNGCYHKLTPTHTRKIHARTLEYFKTVLDSHDKPFVVITHHGPSRQSINQKYKDDYLGNGGYVSSLDEFILDYPKIKLWTHGHVHDFTHYMIGPTRVVCNPRGYNGYETDTGFNPNFEIEI